MTASKSCQEFEFFDSTAMHTLPQSPEYMFVFYFTRCNPYKSFFSILLYLITLTCQIIMQDHLIVQVPDFSEINKLVGPNKAVQVGFFLIYVGENQVLKEKSKKSINVQVLIRLCRCFFPKKTIRFAAQLFGRSEQLIKVPLKKSKFGKFQKKHVH